MFQEITLVDSRPGEASLRTVRARPVGRPYFWQGEGAFGYFILFEGEDGEWFLQRINFFTEPYNFFVAVWFSFPSFEDLECVFLREIEKFSAR